MGQNTNLNIECKEGNQNMTYEEELEKIEERKKEIEEEIKLHKAEKELQEAEEELKKVQPKSRLQKMFGKK